MTLARGAVVCTVTVPSKRVQNPRSICVTGASGYIGLHLLPLLIQRGHRVRAVVRAHRVDELPAECTAIVADVLDHRTYSKDIVDCDTLIHLVGVPHPGPGKEQLFLDVDKKSVDEMILATRDTTIQHIIYLSVAHPAPVMKAYWQIRQQCETEIRPHFARCTFIRPWYVLGPGHRWAIITKPFYAIASLFPALRDGAKRLQLVRLAELLKTLVWAVETEHEGVRILEASDIIAVP